MSTEVSLNFKTYGPLKIASVKPVIFYNSFTIVVYDNDSFKEEPLKIHPEFSVRSILCANKLILCIDDDENLHYGKIKRGTFDVLKLVQSCVLCYSVFDNDLYVLKRNMKELVLIVYSIEKSFKKLREIAVDFDFNISSDDFEVSCCSSDVFSYALKEKFGFALQCKILFLRTHGSVFWLTIPDEYTKKVTVNLLYEAVLPILSITTRKNDLILSLKCGSLVLLSSGTVDALFLNGKIERFAQINDNIFLYTTEGRLCSVELENRCISAIRDQRFKSIHDFAIDRDRSIVYLITDNKHCFAMSFDALLKKQDLDMIRFLRFPSEIEQAKDTVERLKREVAASEMLAEHITIEKHLVLLCMLSLHGSVFERTVNMDISVAGDVLSVKLQFELQFRIRFNEMNRTLKANAWHIVVTTQTRLKNKTISTPIRDLENIEIDATFKKSEVSLPIFVKAFLCLEYSDDCHIVLVSKTKNLSLFDIISQKTECLKSVDDRITAIASKHVGLLRNIDEEPAKPVYSFRLLLSNVSIVSKIFPTSFQSRFKFADFSKSAHPITCFFENSEISLKVIEDDTGLSIEVACDCPRILMHLRVFLTEAIRTVEKETKENDEITSKLVEHANYTRFENFLRDLNDSSRMLNDDGILKNFRKLYEDLLPRLPV